MKVGSGEKNIRSETRLRMKRKLGKYHLVQLFFHPFPPLKLSTFTLLSKPAILGSDRRKGNEKEKIILFSPNSHLNSSFHFLRFYLALFASLAPWIPHPPRLFLTCSSVCSFMSYYNTQDPRASTSGLELEKFHLPLAIRKKNSINRTAKGKTWFWYPEFEVQNSCSPKLHSFYPKFFQGSKEAIHICSDNNW